MGDHGRVEHLPLKPVDLMVLLALHEKDRHGYGIVKDIERYSEGRVRLVPGNLYSVIARLLEWGLVEEADHRGAGERRRHYRITTSGRASLRAEARRLRKLLAIAEAAGVLRGAEWA